MEQAINLATKIIDCGCKDWKMFIDQDGYELPEDKVRLLHSCNQYSIYQKKKSLRRFFIKNEIPR